LLKIIILKKSTVIFIIVAIILLDQILKFYIKLNYAHGDEHKIIGNWFRFHFVENEGMAWGLKYGGATGKIVLTLFRLGAVIWGTFLIKDFIKKQYHKGFIVCVCLIYAGALGNLIDSMFYGLWFDSSYDLNTHQNYGVVAKLLTGKGYGQFLQGKVVDMLYFPIYHGFFPSWMPFWANEPFEFFGPVFNLADASITGGVIAIFLFQGMFFKKPVLEQAKTVPSIEEKTEEITTT
jgi:signal peptidase II